MVEKRVVEFLIKNVNEPVALEIPLGTDDATKIPEIKQALRKAGIRVADDGVRVIQGINTDSVSILTPVMHPNDLMAFYDLLCVVLKEIPNAMPQIAYIRDMKYLPSTKNDNGAPSVGEEMISAAKASGAVIDYDARQDQELRRKFNSTGHIFNGSMIADPYTVLSDFVNRDTRMATSDFLYAIGYAARIKNISGHDQQSLSGARFGFLYEYEQSSGQPFFSNTGIERGSSDGHSGAWNETPVNRFNNKCVAKYLVWRYPKDERQGIYHIFKIPEQDDAWAKMLGKLTPTMHNGINLNGIRSWVQSLIDSDKKPQSVIDGVEAGKLSEIVAEKIASVKDTKAARDKIINETKRIISNMSYIRFDGIDSAINRLSQEISRQNFNVIHGTAKIRETLNKDLISAKKISTDLEAIFVKHGQLHQELKELKKLAGDDADLMDLFKDVDTRMKELDQSAIKTKERFATLISGLESHSKFGMNNMMKDIAKLDDDITNDELRTITPEQRYELMGKIFDENTRVSSGQLGLALRIYIAAQEYERHDLFRYFDNYVAKSKNNHQLFKSAVKEIRYDLPEEIVELSRGKSLFVNHIERARKKIKFISAGKKLEYEQPTTLKFDDMEKE